MIFSSVVSVFAVMIVLDNFQCIIYLILVVGNIDGVRSVRKVFVYFIENALVSVEAVIRVDDHIKIKDAKEIGKLIRGTLMSCTKSILHIISFIYA